FVEMDFERKPRLRRAMPALGTAGRLVREEAHAFEAVSRDGVRRSLQGTRVVRARDTVAAVAATIEEALKLHSGNPTVAREPGLDLHQHGMAAAVRIEDFLAGQGDLHRSPGHDGELGGDELVREDVALPTESPAIRCRRTRGPRPCARSSSRGLARPDRQAPPGSTCNAATPRTAHRSGPALHRRPTRPWRPRPRSDRPRTEPCRGQAPPRPG